jgi:heptosyltransferase-1
LRVLIVKLSSLGDVVQTLPVVHDLLTHVDPVVVDWVVEEAFAPLLGEVLGIERVVRYAGRRWRHRPFAADTRRERAAFLAQLRREPYDAVIDCQGLVKSALVARSARLARGGHRYTYANASELCGYEWPVRYMVDRPLAMERRVHAVRRARLLAARALGYEIDAGDGVSDGVREPAQAPRVDWRFPVPATASRDVMLAHGTTRSDNEWPEPAWADIGQRLVAAGFRVVLPQAGAIEAQRVQRIAAGIGTGAGVEILAPLPLDALARRMAACSGVIGVDSGLSHLAVALDLCHVQIFSQPRVWRAGPVGSAHQVPVGGAHTPSAEEVWAAWQQVWAARDEGRAA